MDGIDPKFVSSLTIWWIVVVSILGLIMNLILAAIIIKKQFVWSIDIKLLLFLAIVDILLCIIILVVSLVKYYLNIDFNHIDPMWCQIAGVCITLMDVCSLSFITLLSFERFFLICRNKPNTCRWGLVIAFVYVGIGLVFATMAASKFAFKTTSSGGYCTVSPSVHPLGLPYFCYLFISFNLALAMVTFCYLNIILTSKKHIEYMKTSNIIRRIQSYNNMFKEETTSNTTRTLTTATSNISGATARVEEPDFQIYPEKIKFKVIFRSTLFIMIYITCFIPNIVSWWISMVTFKPWSMVLDIVIMCTFNMAQLVNPLLALSLHTTIKKEFFALFRFRS